MLKFFQTHKKVTFVLAAFGMLLMAVSLFLPYLSYF